MNARAMISRSAVVLGIVLISLTGSVRTASAQQSRTISVNGGAEVRVVPDEVMLTLGVETVDKVLKTAKTQNDERVAKVLAIAKQYEIPNEYVQTDFISIEPRYRDNYEQREFIGYFVRKTIVIRIKDLAKFEGLLSDVLEAGTNYVHGIEFRTTELRKYRDQARAMAIKAAKEKATALAAELDLKVGKAISIQEYSGGWYSPYGSFGSGSSSGMMSQNVMQNAASSGGGSGSSDTDSTLAPGQISVFANVSVTFELE